VADLSDAGAPPADLTVVVVNATRCEPTAILATRDDGTVLFFSMATNFTTAALTADGMTSCARMIVGSGYTPDAGSYALDL
jgi:L-erythro-3,5-diaminohexanoate dehydrogenase